ncbi:hypothetical protein GCM10010195_04060 [Kitasatospora griseola]|nr:hypothetical protein GCM10010195_04060 [Kitasatospora griseola]
MPHHSPCPERLRRGPPGPVPSGLPPSTEGPSGPMVVTVPVLTPVVEEVRVLREKLLVERWPWS